MGESERARPIAGSGRLAAVILAIAAAALALGACASQAPPAPPPTGDPITHGHSIWCGTNPPSGYCMYD